MRQIRKFTPLSAKYIETLAPKKRVMHRISCMTHIFENLAMFDVNKALEELGTDELISFDKQCLAYLICLDNNIRVTTGTIESNKQQVYLLKTSLDNILTSFTSEQVLADYLIDKFAGGLSVS